MNTLYLKWWSATSKLLSERLILIIWRVFIKYCVILKIFSLFFLNSASSAAALVFYLPGVCNTH